METMTPPALDAGDAGEEVHRLLRRIIHAVDLRSQRVRQQTGLTTPQAVVLRAVDALGAGTTRALATEVSLSQATVTLILDKLADKELLERYRSVSDRRVMHARLTAAGRRTLRRLPPLLQESFHAGFAALDSGRRTALIESLRGLASMLDVADATPVMTPARERHATHH